MVCKKAADYYGGNQSDVPRPGVPQLVSRLPAELPQRVSGFAYDGQKFWAAIYHGKGRYATFDPRTRAWTASESEEQHRAVREVASRFESPGGICFVGRRLWVGGSYGESFGAINTLNWKVERLFNVRQREDRASQSYAGMAYDGSHLWMAWHWMKYDLPAAQTQLLLKVDLETGKVVGEFPAPPGTPNDLTHALAWDGARLWHMKDDRLTAVDPQTGAVTALYELSQIKRASGMAWDGEALWMMEFNGTLWRVPLTSSGA